ncbi:hypothetical protein A6K26_009135 [Gammaproteobacteria bacterium 2W06]|nr:hypothetical protein A6K26_009135 [Gammaproteobacteria bacterium 2W06]
MPHKTSGLNTQQALSLLRRHFSVLIRWDESFDQIAEGEWWHIIKDAPETLETLSSNTRNQVRRGLKSTISKPTTREVVLNEGYEVYRSAFDRYETFEAMFSPSQFREAVEALPAETEFWEARNHETGELVAFSENLVRDEACFYNTMWFQPEALKAYAGYALIHEMNKHYLNERGLRYVSDGARSISHDTNIHDFLEQKFGFRRAYARLRVVYFPGVGAAVRLLYPLRQWFAGRSSGVFQKIAVLLEQERIRRACIEPEEKA